MTDLIVPQTILAHLGGKSFVMTSGATGLVGSADGLTFKLGRNPKRVTHVRVMVTHDGLYDMTFYGTCPLSQGPSKRPADRARQALSRSGRMAAAHERTGSTI